LLLLFFELGYDSDNFQRAGQADSLSIGISILNGEEI